MRPLIMQTISKLWMMSGMLLCTTVGKAQINVDSDNDGLDDQWEINNGLDPNNPKDAWMDDDQDEVVNLFEFQLDTDPFDASTPVRIVVVEEDNL